MGSALVAELFGIWDWIGIEFEWNFSSWSLSESVLPGQLGVTWPELTGNSRGDVAKGAERNLRIPES